MNHGNRHIKRHWIHRHNANIVGSDETDKFCEMVMVDHTVAVGNIGGDGHYRNDYLFHRNAQPMKAEEKANEIAYNEALYNDNMSLGEQCEIAAMQMYQWAQDEFMQKAENAYCNQCIKNPCRIKIKHGSLCYECELFLKSILKEL